MGQGWCLSPACTVSTFCQHPAATNSPSETKGPRVSWNHRTRQLALGLKTYTDGMGFRARPTGLLWGEQGRPQASWTGCQDVVVRARAQGQKPADSKCGQMPCTKELQRCQLHLKAKKCPSLGSWADLTAPLSSPDTIQNHLCPCLFLICSSSSGDWALV